MLSKKSVHSYEELVKNYKVDYIAGGSTQNTMRVGQWAVQKPKQFAFIGCVGNDANGKTLYDVASKAGVAVHYKIDAETPTGVCGVLLTGKQRYLALRLSEISKTNYTLDLWSPTSTPPTSTTKSTCSSPRTGPSSRTPSSTTRLATL